jgi:TrmH RNA methyltransferase
MKPRPARPAPREAPLPSRPSAGRPARESDRRLAPPGSAAPSSPRPEQGARRDTELIYGVRAALAVFERRPADVLHVAFSQVARRHAEPLIQWSKRQGVDCREAGDRELEQLAASTHHEGLCVLTRARRWASPGELAESLVRARGFALALDRVRNPYNVGAVLRSAAFFGVEAALLGAPAPHPGLAPDAVRVAEGGIEHLLMSRTTDLADTLARLRDRGVQIIGADGGSNVSALGYPFARPAVLVMGNEREGLGERIRACCDAIVAIPGSGAVESLNVAVAAGVLIAEMVRGRLVGPRVGIDVAQPPPPLRR